MERSIFQNFRQFRCKVLLFLIVYLYCGVQGTCHSLGRAHGVCDRYGCTCSDRFLTPEEFLLCAAESTCRTHCQVGSTVEGALALLFLTPEEFLLCATEYTCRTHCQVGSTGRGCTCSVIPHSWGVSPLCLFLTPEEFLLCAAEYTCRTHCQVESTGRGCTCSVIPHSWGVSPLCCRVHLQDSLPGREYR